MDNSEYLKLVSKINASAINPDNWSDCLEGLKTYLGGTGCFFFTYDDTQDVTTSVLTVNFDAAELASYAAYYHTINPYLIGNKKLASDIAVTDQDSALRSEVRKSEFYHDWFKNQEVDVFQFGCKIQIDRDRYAAFVIFPPEKKFEGHEEEGKRKLSALIPYLKNSLSANYILEERSLMPLGLDLAFSRFDIGVLVLDNQFRVLVSNNTAEEFLNKQDFIRTERHTGELKASHPESAKRLSRLLMHGRAGLVVSDVQRIALHSISGGDACFCSVQPVPAEPFDMVGQGSGNFSLLSKRPRVLVLLSRPGKAEAPPPKLLMSLFGLTLAEAKLASAIANGENLTSYAKYGGISRNTVKTHLASIFDKTGVSRQAELVALIWRSLAPPGF